MASYSAWLNEHGAMVDFTNTARAPSKDFYQIFITPSEFVYRLWKIVPPTRPDNHPAPSEVRDSWADFKTDERLHSEIQRVSGVEMLNYLMNVIHGRLDYLCRLPEKVLLKIILMLDLETIAHLSMTCTLFRQLCFSDYVWERIYMMHNKQPITQELLLLAERRGWRQVFFTNKLQLQVQMRRIASAGGNVAFLTQGDEEQK